MNSHVKQNRAPYAIPKTVQMKLCMEKLYNFYCLNYDYERSSFCEGDFDDFDGKGR